MTTEKKGATVPEKKKETVPAKVELSQSERFTQEVMKQFTNNAGDLQLTAFQKRLIQNYFIKIDQNLKDLEKKRLATSEQYRSGLEFHWKNVNLAKLAVDVVAWSSVGLDPAQPNHVNCIPYKNAATSKFDIGFIPGYKGIELKAKKYGLDIPDEVVVELIYSSDKFKQIKKDLNNKYDTYTFEITNELNRGEVIGGFYYHNYFANPAKNKMRVFSKEQIEKRKPDTASPEFWGGEKDNWVPDPDRPGKKKKDGKVKVDGWYEEMAWKTVFRAGWNAITIDSQKIDDHYQSVLERERELRDERVILEIRENANTGEAIGFEEEKEVKVHVLNDGAQAEAETSETEHQEEEQESGSESTTEAKPAF